MDEDPVLRALGEDLSRDDPDLAARLAAGPSAGGTPPGRGLLWGLIAVVAGGVLAPVVFGPVAFGVLGVLVLLAGPIAVAVWALPPADP
jgi:hypothetical protein